MLEIDTTYDSKRKIWEGPKMKHLYNPKVSFGQVILNMLTMYGPKIAQISDDFEEQSTFHEILTKTIRVSQNLQKFDVEPKCVFGIIANNGPDLAPIVFASLCLGCPISAIDPSFGKFEMKSIMNATKPKVFFCDVTIYVALIACLRELNISARIFTLNGQCGKSTSVDVLFTETNEEDSFLPVDVDGEYETAIIAGSFGISGAFEGICLSHALLLDKSTRLKLTCEDVVFAFASLYWLSGISNLLKATYFGATRIITTKSYAPDLLLQLTEKYKISHLFASMQQITSALNQECVESVDLSSVRFLALSGQKLLPNPCLSINKYFKNAVPHNLYGCSELGGAISVARGDNSSLRSSGKLVNGIQVKIIDENGNRLGIGERGRIHAKSAYYFLGYYGKEKVDTIIDEEIFLKTGDVGYFDKDGFLHVIGREADVIKYKNHHISPNEIEDVLAQHPNIKSVCVVGVPTLDDGDLVTALIVQRENATIAAGDVLKFISDHLDDSHKLRGGVYFVDSLPSTRSGKIIRRLARAIAEKEFGCRNKVSMTT